MLGYETLLAFKGWLSKERCLPLVMPRGKCPRCGNLVPVWGASCHHCQFFIICGLLGGYNYSAAWDTDETDYNY